MQTQVAAEMANIEQKPQDPCAMVMPLLPLAEDDPTHRIPALRHTLAWQPGSATHWMQLGLAYLAAANPRSAQDALRKALQLDSTNRAARVGLAQVLSLQGYCLDAAQLCFEGLASDPSSMELHQALAEAFMQAGLFAQAGNVVRDAMALNGNGVQSSLLSAALLYRQHRFDACLETLDHVLAAEPGHALARRLQADALLVSGRSQQRCDQAAPLCAADAATMASWQALLAPWHGLKVGLVWADHDPRPQALLRSMPLAEFAPLAGMPGVTFFSLQRGEAAREAVAPPDGIDCVCLTEALASPPDVAAALRQMDLVIAVDCETARQAAAIGCRIWIVLPEPACAHWMREREEAPAYPNVRLFRQQRRGAWGPALHQVAAALLELANEYATAGKLNDTQKKLVAARTAAAQYRYPDAERLYRELLTHACEVTPQLIGAVRHYIARSGRYRMLDGVPPPTTGPSEKLLWMTDLRACTLAQRGKHAAAFALWDALVDLGMPALAPLLHYGDAAHRAREWQRAVRVWEKAMALYPDATQPPLRAAYSYKEQGDPDKAIACFRRSLALSPCQPMVHHDLGCLLRDQNNTEEALQHLQKALYLHPGHASGWQTLGHLLYHNGRYRAACACFEQAIALEPSHFAWLHLGYCHFHLRQFEQAAAMLSRAFMLSPNDKDALFFKALALYESHRYKEAIAAFEEIQRNHPNDEYAVWALAWLYLITEDFSKGWPAMYRYNKRPVRSKPEWNGEPLDGKILLVSQWHGFGDMIQFSRTLPLIRAGKITLAVRPELMRLFKTAAGVDKLVSLSNVDLDALEYDYHTNEIDLLRLLPDVGTTRSPVPVPYLHVDPALQKVWRQRIGDDGSFRIGIAWCGNASHYPGHDARTTQLAHWLPIARVPGVSLYSLQKDSAASQVQDVPDLQIRELSKAIDDFADLAAVMSCLDLIITVDSSPAHLAGALGRPVWTLLPSVRADWRWLAEREDSPWYPSMRLFRQGRHQSWEEMLLHVRDALVSQLEQRKACR